MCVHPRPARRSALLACIAVVATTACVTRGTYEEVVEERDALDAELARLRAENRDLETDLAGVRADRESLQAELAKLEITYESLVTELRDEVEAGQVTIEQLRDGVKVNLSQDVLFPSGSAELDAQGRAILERVAERIAGDSVITVEGHTDGMRISPSLKSRYPTNWELGGARAAAVVRLLSEQGIDPKRLRAVSRGPFDPVASNETPEGRRRNRRIEILLRPAER